MAEEDEETKGDGEDAGAGRRPRSFAGLDLSGEDLRESHLAGADLTGTKLRRANLHGLDLRGARLREAVLDGADLQDALLDGADLGSASLQGVAASGASLTGADLTLAHLRDGDFRSANLTGAALTDADLSQATFERAILTDANLIGAELGGASFRDANLCGANLREAHVDGADFTGARFAFTVLAASDVSRARGLEAVVHDGPSTVGVDAFLLSRGEIPDAFLTGIGLSPLTIEYLKAVAAAEEGMLVGDAIFLLFADADRTRARRLRAYLRMHRHQSWYWQETRILAGTHNPDLKLRIRFHDRLLVLGSEALSRDAHAGAPIREALAKEATEHRSIVLVARLDDSAPEGWPAGLGERVGADFRGVAWDDPQDAIFRRELERLLAALRGEVSGGGGGEDAITEAVRGAPLTPTPDRIVVEIDADLRELIPDFLASRRREAEKAAEAFPRRDYETLRQLGHNMKGVGGSFGFDAITEMGHALETAAAAADDERIRALLADFTAYLDRVEVVYAE